MKTINALFAGLLLTVSVCFTQQAKAQAPQHMSYQSVIRNSSNALVATTPVSMQISLLQGTASGTAVYIETQTATTNANGLVSIEIGTGAATTGTFSEIDWATGPYFIKTEIDPAGGSNYTITGAQQMASVPYALYAKTSGNGQGPAGPQGIEGPAGEDGTNGLDGINGLSAYQVWIGLGNTGTETDFINSLTGPQGAPGETGSQGAQGIDGPQGPVGNNGMNGANGLDGNGIVSTTDNGDGTFTFIYNDGSTFTTSDLTGPAGSQDAWGLTGNAGTDPTTNFIGTIDAQDVVIKTNNTESVRVLSSGAVGIGSTPDVSAKLEVSSTSQGFLPPRLTSAERDAIASPAVGLVIYNTTTNCLNFYIGSDWIQTCGSAEQPLVQPTYPAGSVFCSGATLVVNVLNPATGKIWMDRNLGASQAVTSSTDAAAYGDLYQWGRSSDGHQCRNSATTTVLSTTDQPENGNFIASSTSYDWRNPNNANLWQGVNGVNNPCPSGYRLPTETELEAERTSWSINNPAGAFASPLKLPLAGVRERSEGVAISFVGTHGIYWSSSDGGGFRSPALSIQPGGTGMVNTARIFGFSVRCLKD